MLANLSAPERLALAYASSRSRPATLALLALDARLGATLRGRREPLSTQLRLAWWRESLAQLPPASTQVEPVLDALRSWQNPAALAVLPDAWEALLVEELTPQAIADFVNGRAEAFACLARELGANAVDDAAAAARVWALADLAANVSEGAERERIVRHGRTLPTPGRLPSSLRPLAVLAGLGARALQLGGVPLLSGPGSALLALRIGFTGR